MRYLPCSGVWPSSGSLDNLKLGSTFNHEFSSATGSRPLLLFLDEDKGRFLLDLLDTVMSIHMINDLFDEQDKLIRCKTKPASSAMVLIGSHEKI